MDQPHETVEGFPPAAGPDKAVFHGPAQKPRSRRSSAIFPSGSTTKVDFVELVVRGASAAERFGLRPGEAPLHDRTTPYAVWGNSEYMPEAGFT